jgi:hypothetical protein
MPCPSHPTCFALSPLILGMVAHSMSSEKMNTLIVYKWIEMNRNSGYSKILSDNITHCTFSPSHGHDHEINIHRFTVLLIN